MNSLDDRKKGFDDKYQRDEEAQFKIKAIRNKLIGQWAADLINPEDQEVYIKTKNQIFTNSHFCIDITER